MKTGVRIEAQRPARGGRSSLERFGEPAASPGPLSRNAVRPGPLSGMQSRLRWKWCHVVVCHSGGVDVARVVVSVAGLLAVGLRSVV